MERYTLADVLDHGTTVLVDLHAGIAITWNESATFNVWQNVTNDPLPAFELATAFTNHNATSGTAATIAKEWLEDAQENHDF
jgi:hypothetical protein